MMGFTKRVPEVVVGLLRVNFKMFVLVDLSFSILFIH